MPITIKRALKVAKESLANIAERPLYEAEILMCYLLGKDRAYIHTHDDEDIDEMGFLNLINRRAKGEPIEYITQSASFYGLDFFVKSGVLIPRPETELLVDEVLKVVGDTSLKIAEIGVGSGAISVVLALKRGAYIVATDIAETPIEVAAINAKRHGVSEKIELYKTNLLDGIDYDFDIIISNPPYIATSYSLPKPVKYEPKEALFSGSDGMDMIKAIIDLALKRGVKYLFCEMGYDQKELVEKFANGVADLTFYRDYAGFWRGFVAKFRHFCT